MRIVKGIAEGGQLERAASYIWERIKRRSLVSEEFDCRAPKGPPDKVGAVAESRGPVQEPIDKENRVDRAICSHEGPTAFPTASCPTSVMDLSFGKRKGMVCLDGAAFGRSGGHRVVEHKGEPSFKLVCPLLTIVFRSGLLTVVDTAG